VPLAIIKRVAAQGLLRHTNTGKESSAMGDRAASVSTPGGNAPKLSLREIATDSQSHFLQLLHKTRVQSQRMAVSLGLDKAKMHRQK
jgi:hypothetical protein